MLCKETKVYLAPFRPASIIARMQITAVLTTLTLEPTKQILRLWSVLTVSPLNIAVSNFEAKYLCDYLHRYFFKKINKLLTIDNWRGIILLNGGGDMWTSNKSINLSLALCVILILAIILAGILAPVYLDEFFGFFDDDMTENSTKSIAFLSCFYPSAIIGIVALFSLMKMLKRIKREDPFCRSNVNSLRIISLCFFIVALITFIGCFFYKTFIFVSASTGFLGLILRVVKNVIQTAVELREESDLTI